MHVVLFYLLLGVVFLLTLLLASSPCSQHKSNLLRQVSFDHTSEYLFLLSACLSGQICPVKHQRWWWGVCVESILKEGPRTKVFPSLHGNERKNLVWMKLGNENYFCLGLLRLKYQLDIHAQTPHRPSELC